MSVIHFLNVLEGDCNIIQHDSGRVTVIDVSNAANLDETPAEHAVQSSAERQAMFTRDRVPTGKRDFRQKLQPDNPIEYLQKRLKVQEIFRFIITHPDMDHLDGIRDLFSSIQVNCFWDTDNKKQMNFVQAGGYNKEDWDFYVQLRDGKIRSDGRRAFYAGNFWHHFDADNLHILAPTQALVQEANESGDYNDSSYVLLYTPPKRGGGNWKFLFAGDSHDKTWEHILAKYKTDVSNVDVLFAPHHGRDSARNYDFLDAVNPTLTLFGNASSDYLAYDCYPETRITNNQAGFVIMDVTPDSVEFFVKHREFANHFRNNPKRKWGNAVYSENFKAYGLCVLIA